MSALYYNIYFYFKWFIHFWGAKRKLSFIKSLTHASQTRINSLSFYLCGSFNSVIMEQRFSDLFLSMWAADCVVSWDLSGRKIITSALWDVVVQNPGQWLCLSIRKEAKYFQHLFFFGRNYKSCRHTHFMRLIKCVKQSPSMELVDARLSLWDYPKKEKEF